MKTVDQVLEELQTIEQKLPGKLIVFGSIARGSSSPGDVDVALDLLDIDVSRFTGNDRSLRISLNPLLVLARKYYGSFDPFFMIGVKDPWSDRNMSQELWVRDDDARFWKQAKNARSIFKNIAAEGKSLTEAIESRSLILRDSVRGV